MRSFIVTCVSTGIGWDITKVLVLHALNTPKPRLRYAVVPGCSSSRVIQQLLPRRVIDGIIAKNLGFKQNGWMKSKSSWKE